MGRLFTVVKRTAMRGSVLAVLGIVLGGFEVFAAPLENDRQPAAAVSGLGADASSDLPELLPRPPALELLWFDPSRTLSSSATAVLAEEVREIFQGLGVEVGFRVAASDATYGESPIPEVPIILLKDDPIVSRRPSRVLGLVVRHQEPNRAVWAFLENVSWTLGLDRNRDRPAAARDVALGLALARVVAHEVIHAMAPEEPHAKAGLMSHSMNRAFLLGDNAPLDARCGRAFLSGLAARTERAPADATAATLASFR
jgi:hypothetical protein